MFNVRLMLLAAVCVAASVVPAHGAPAHRALKHRTVQTAAAGYLVAWGANSQGQLGSGRCCVPNPVPAPVIGLDHVVAMVAGQSFSIALRSDGTVWEWGCCERGKPRLRPVQVGGLTEVTAVAGGADFGVALKNDGTVWTWGIGNSNNTGWKWRNSKVPLRVRKLTAVTAIAAGGGFGLALRADGTVWAWGDGGTGQLGDGRSGIGTWTVAPVQVRALSAVAHIAAGLGFGLAIERDGTVWAWGANEVGELGAPLNPETICKCSAIPVRVPGLTEVTAIAAGDSHTAAVRSDGTVWTWGFNELGQLGIGTRIGPQLCPSYGPTPACSTRPVQVLGLTEVMSVAAGSAHTLALKQDGTVWVWGSRGNSYVQPGNCNCVDRPVQVQNLRGAIAAAAGVDHNLAVLRRPIPVPKPRLCEGGPRLVGPNHFPRTVRLYEPEALAVSEQTGHVFVANHGWYDCGSSVTILAARTGAPLRVVPVGENPYLVLAADRLKRVFVVNQGNTIEGLERKGSVSVLDTGSGRLLYTAAVGLAPGPIAVDERTWRAFVLHGRGGSYLSTLAVARGNVLRTVHLPYPGLGSSKLVVDEQAGRLFVADQRLLMLDAGNGRLLRTIRMPGVPVDVAVGEAGRVFVLNAVTCGSTGQMKPVVVLLDGHSGAIQRTVDLGCRYPISLFSYAQLVMDDAVGLVLVLRPTWGMDGAPEGAALDARSGRIVRASGRLVYPPAEVDSRTGSVYGYRWYSWLVLFDPKRWRTVRYMPAPFGSEVSLAVAARAQRVFLVDRSANLSNQPGNRVVIFRAGP